MMPDGPITGAGRPFTSKDDFSTQVVKDYQAYFAGSSEYAGDLFLNMISGRGDAPTEEQFLAFVWTMKARLLVLKASPELTTAWVEQLIGKAKNIDESLRQKALDSQIPDPSSIQRVVQPPKPEPPKLPPVRKSDPTPPPAPKVEKPASEPKAPSPAKDAPKAEAAPEPDAGPKQDNPDDQRLLDDVFAWLGSIKPSVAEMQQVARAEKSPLTRVAIMAILAGTLLRMTKSPKD